MAIIVLVDDNELFGKQMKDYFEIMWGHTTFQYTSGKEIIEELENGLRYDVAIVDADLGDMKGEYIIKKMKEIHPETPVIFSTGYSMLSSRYADYIIPKGFDAPQTLKHTLESILK